MAALRSLARTLWRAPVTTTGGPRMSPASSSRPLTSQRAYGTKREDKGYDQRCAELENLLREQLREAGRRSEMWSGVMFPAVAAVGFALNSFVCLGAGFGLGVYFTLEALREAVEEMKEGKLKVGEDDSIKDMNNEVEQL